MGMVIKFSEPVRYARRSGLSERNAESATVIILPVVRIERFVEESSAPGASRSQRRRRRRRVSQT